VWSSNGRKIAFVKYTDGIFIINSDGTGLIRVTEADGYIPRWSLDSKRLAFLSNSDIYVVNTEGSTYKTSLDLGQITACLHGLPMDQK